MGSVEYIYRYPVKSLSGESLSYCDLVVGKTIVGDRAYALAHASSVVDPAQPVWQKKRQFLNLAIDEKLGELTTAYENSHTLSIARQGRTVVHGDISTAHGRLVIENFLAAFMPSGARGNPRLVTMDEGHFCDQAEACLSLINLATLEDIERVVRQPLDHRRMRGNIYVSGLEAWQEKDWVGQTVTIGEAAFAVVDDVERCNAININPETGKVDTNIPLALRKGFRHADCGVFLQVTQAGRLGVGDTLHVE